MNSFELIKFECKKHITSFTFLIIFTILTIFSITQIGEIFHIPINNEKDLSILNKIGERDLILIPYTDNELKNKSLNFIQKNISEGNIPETVATQFEPVIMMLQSKDYSFEDIFTTMKNNELIFPWLVACKSQFSAYLGSVEEVNSNIKISLGNKGYSQRLYIKYVTYMQVITSFLIFPIFILMFIRDYKYSMYEIIYSQPTISTQYLLCRFFSIFIVIAIYLYVFGLILNIISIVKFINAGYIYKYTPFIGYYIIYILPTLFFLSSLIMLLILLIKKVIAIFPLYILYLIFNVTPHAFNSKLIVLKFINPIIRLDGAPIGIDIIIINRIIYCILSIIILVISCKIYKKLRYDLRKVITI